MLRLKELEGNPFQIRKIIPLDRKVNAVWYEKDKGYITKPVVCLALVWEYEDISGVFKEISDLYELDTYLDSSEVGIYQSVVAMDIMSDGTLDVVSGDNLVGFIYDDETIPNEMIKKYEKERQD